MGKDQLKVVGLGDEQGVPQDSQLTDQLHALGREVTRASRQFLLQRPTKQDAARAEAEIGSAQ